jgi:putative transposase
MAEKWTRKTLPAELLALESWPSIDVTTLSAEQLTRFERYKSAIESYLAGARLNVIYERYRIKIGELLYQLNRCVSPATDGRIQGWRSLMKGVRVKQYKRTASEDWKGKAGLSGCFDLLLTTHPRIKSELIRHIKKKGKGDRIAESGSAFRGIFQKFLDLCVEEGVNPRGFPFTTQSKGSASVRRFFHKIIEDDFAVGARLLGGNKGASRAKVGTGVARFLITDLPYDTWQLDEHKLDFIGVVRISTPKGFQLIPISRMVLIAVADVQCPCIVGYHVAIRKEASAEEIVQAVSSALGRWQPRTLGVDYLAYKPGAGLPSGVIPELEGACCAELQIDNSYAHWSTTVTTRIRERTGISINWGPIATWVRRDVIERIFGILEKRSFHRLSSTMGTGPGDSRVDDPIGKALKLKIEFEELLDIIDVVIANFNASPSAALGGRTPLDVLREYLEFNREGFLPRHLPQLPSHVPEMNVSIYTATICGSQQGNVSRQYIEKLYARYTSPLLAQGAALIGKRVRLHIRPQDPRTAMAFFENGNELGMLTAMGCYGVKPHTLEMRKEIGYLKRLGQLEILQVEDEISAYQRYLAEKAIKDNTNSKRRGKISRVATKLAHYGFASGESTAAIDQKQVAQKEPTPSTSMPPDAAWPSFLDLPDFSGKAE